MYPNLLPSLLILSVVLLGGVAYFAVRQPVSRRLALRQLIRRRSEAMLAVVGSALGIAIIAGSLVVGDTMNFSVRQGAYRTLGPIDERVVSTNSVAGDAVAARLAGLHDPNVTDGVLSAHVGQGAAATFRGPGGIAEPRVLFWQLNLDAAARFGAAGGDSGLHGPDPEPGEVVINAPLADALNLRTGDAATFYLFGTGYRLRVVRVVPERGLAGMGLGGSLNRNAFVAPGLLDAAAAAAGTSPEAVTFVSNRGGVEGGSARTDAAVKEIRAALGPMADRTLVETPKRDVLDAAKQTGDSLGALFLMIGSFSIIAGALLLVNIFVMLAEERKSQLGMLRAIGMRRSRMIGSFVIEGATYALASVVPGLLLGLGVGWAVAQVAARIFESGSGSGEDLAITFSVTPVSMINAGALGLVIGLAAIIATSVRISRFNVIGAIRDLPPVPAARTRQYLLIIATALAAVFAVISIPAVARSQAESTYLFPSLAAFCAIPLLRRLVGGHAAVTSASAAVLGWCLVAPLVRPHMFDAASMAAYVIEGSLLAFSAVLLVSQNQHVVLRPLRALFERPSEGGLALHLAVAYPLAKRFRTGATLVMYTLITLVLVLLVEIAGIINASVDHNVAEATAGYSLRLDLNATAEPATAARLRREPEVSAVTPLLQAPALASDPAHRVDQPLRAIAVGVPPGSMSPISFSSRLPGLSDWDVWHLIDFDSRYVVLDRYFGQISGPNGNYYDPGDTFTLTDPRTGRVETKTIAGILDNAYVFYPADSGALGSYPVIGSATAVRAQFGVGAQPSAALVRTVPGTDVTRLGTHLQAKYLTSSLAATAIAPGVRRMFAANVAFFQLMQAFLALGLLVSITGLGVVMVRAVRERRRTIGVLRALGFRARTVERSFLLESGLVALQGIVLGSALGVLTTWLMYQKSANFEGVRIAFPIQWATIGALAGATLIASVAATFAPARRAAHIRPAIAVRVSD